MRLNRVVLWVAVTLLFGAVGPMAEDRQDQESRIVSDKWYFGLGSSVASFNTEASIGFGTVLGSFIRIEDDLDLDDGNSSFRLNGIYAFNPKHAIDFTITDFSRDGQILIDEEITIGDEGEEIVYEIGADVTTEFDSRNIKIFYKYSFVNNGRTQAGIGAGLSFFDYSFSLEGVARIDDGSTEIRRVDEDVLAPIPSFLMFIHHGITPNLIFRATAGFFDLEIDDYEGGLIETRLTLDYFFTKRFAVGGGVEGSRIDFKDHGENPLTVQVDETAVVFYVAFAF